MSRASIEQALTGLIPAINGPLPPELIEFALSLLARSRSAAHSLKSDEEIARPYACAQLACERTKQRFNLPTIVSRPPCPPRIYKKLYNYLSSVLPAPESTREPRTPSKRATTTAVSARNTPKTPLSGRRTPQGTRKLAASAGAAPEWVMPAIRSLVKTFDIANAAPHVYTGVESVLPLLESTSSANNDSPSKRPRRDVATSQPTSAAVPDVRIRALVIIIFLYIYNKMRDVEVTPEQYKDWRETAITALLGMPSEEEIAYEDLSMEAEELMPMAQSEGWLEMEWFMNITPLEDMQEMEGVEFSGASQRSAVTPIGGSDYIGLGTMMQDATDYLGESRRQDYVAWKATIMARVQQIEAA
ncbi:origin recognition complex, subunit 6 [Phaeosphaeria sp. MPI-PUGE-AT-0046c]|nr:origin recognition complex, subunit 6 [Phaeosphaeria sp. MPI-PUGE-AT-0046c]